MDGTIDKIPHKPGVYIMRDAAEKINYIGKAKDLNRRVSSYFGGDIIPADNGVNSAVPEATRGSEASLSSFRKRSGDDRKIVDLLLGKIRKIDYIVASSERDALLLEDALIKKFKPFYNILLRDDKSYPCIKLSSNSWPALSIERSGKRKNIVHDERDLYFGPYPYTSNLKQMVEWLKDIFGLRKCSLDLDKKNQDFSSCIYLQTNKCPAPCVEKISKSEYMKNVARSKIFLQGHLGKMKNMLMAQMNNYSQKMEFEKAGAVKNILESINSMNEKIRFREISSEGVELLTAETRGLANMQQELQLKNFPSDIDAIDISNFGGEECVGAGVRFHMGEPDKSKYRKYKIKTVKGQNDFAMVQEVFRRRYSGMIDERPDLIIIDGGKGQLDAGITVLKSFDLLGKIDIISLSKGEKGNDKIHTIDKGIMTFRRSQYSLRLLQRIRDEAHRFAISYHRHLRAKKFKG